MRRLRRWMCVRGERVVPSHTSETEHDIDIRIVKKIGIVIISILTLNWNCFHRSSKRHGRMPDVSVQFSLRNFCSMCQRDENAQWYTSFNEYGFRWLLFFSLYGCNLPPPPPPLMTWPQFYEMSFGLLIVSMVYTVYHHCHIEKELWANCGIRIFEHFCWFEWSYFCICVGDFTIDALDFLVLIVFVML